MRLHARVKREDMDPVDIPFNQVNQVAANADQFRRGDPAFEHRFLPSHPEPNQAPPHPPAPLWIAHVIGEKAERTAHANPRGNPERRIALGGSVNPRPVFGRLPACARR